VPSHTPEDSSLSLATSIAAELPASEATAEKTITSIGVFESSGPMPEPRAMILLRAIAATIVPRKPATMARYRILPIEPPSSRPTRAPTTVPTSRTIKRLADVILGPPFVPSPNSRTGFPFSRDSGVCLRLLVEKSDRRDKRLLQLAFNLGHGYASPS